jgi:hypothetical protein
MKTKHIFAVLTILSIALFAPMSRAAWITAISSGNWGDPNIWDSGTVPGTNDFAEIDPAYTVNVTTNAVVQYIIGDINFVGGAVIMAPNATLEILDASASGTWQLSLLDASAPGNTVIYDGNPYYAKRQNYYNLVFINTLTNQMDFYNGFVNSHIPTMPMTIAGDFTVTGKTKVQQGDNFTINGNLILNSNATWDCSSYQLTLKSNLTLGAGCLLVDLDGALGSNHLGGNVLVTAAALGWNLKDVTQWAIGGSLTNNGTLVGAGYGSISFDGTGVITGSKAIKIPTLTINGTYTIGTPITLTTNTPTLNGTLVFDIAHTNSITLGPGAGTPLYYSGNLNVINSGAEPASGASFTFFHCVNGFDGAFTSTSFPSLSGGKSWVDNLVASGSVAVISGSLGLPAITLSRNNSVLTLTWDSATYPGYRVLAQTNSTLGNTWYNAGSNTNSPFAATINPANPAVFYRLTKP